MKTKIILLHLFLIVFTVIGCTKKIESLKVQTIEVKSPLLNLSKPTPVKLEKIEWVIVQNGKEKFVGMTFDNYKKLSVNMEKIQGFILKQEHIIDQQKKYYERE